jgi:hypothetical protein
MSSRTCGPGGAERLEPSPQSWGRCWNTLALPEAPPNGAASISEARPGRAPKLPGRGTLLTGLVQPAIPPKIALPHRRKRPAGEAAERQGRHKVSSSADAILTRVQSKTRADRTGCSETDSPFAFSPNPLSAAAFSPFVTFLKLPLLLSNPISKTPGRRVIGHRKTLASSCILNCF